MTEEEVMDKIEFWHLEYDGEEELHEFLGWSWADYVDYCQSGKIPNV